MPFSAHLIICDNCWPYVREKLAVLAHVRQGNAIPEAIPDGMPGSWSDDPDDAVECDLCNRVFDPVDEDVSPTEGRACVVCGRDDVELHTNMRCGNCGRGDDAPTPMMKCQDCGIPIPDPGADNTDPDALLCDTCLEKRDQNSRTPDVIISIFRGVGTLEHTSNDNLIIEIRDYDEGKARDETDPDVRHDSDGEPYVDVA